VDADRDNQILNKTPLRIIVRRNNGYGDIELDTNNKIRSGYALTTLTT
jgi:hypothetical protein